MPPLLVIARARQSAALYGCGRGAVVSILQMTKQPQEGDGVQGWGLKPGLAPNLGSFSDAETLAPQHRN